MADHWSDKISDKIVETFPDEKEYTLAAGISPSGSVHIGNFRDIITVDAVHRALEKRNLKSRVLFSWDDFDKFRKVPNDVPKEFEKYLGLPLAEVPDPWGEFSSYAEHFEKEFESSLDAFGIAPQTRRQYHEYKTGRYDNLIRRALEKRKEIATILARFKTQGMTAEEITNYFPVNVYSRFTGKDNTRVLSFDGDRKIVYECKETGKRDEIDFTQDHRIKLPWKVDWPMRWLAEGVNFEPGGDDHASPGGSYDVSRFIAKEAFDRTPPLFQGYAFIGIRGLPGKMSGSVGGAISPAKLLEIYEPELIRWLFLKVDPKQAFDFAFDSEVFRQYSEFDKEVARMQKENDGLLELIKPRKNSHLAGEKAIPFRQSVGHGQVIGFDRNRLESLLVEANECYDSQSIDSRLQRAKNWLQTYNSSSMVRLLESPNEEYARSLSPDSRKYLAQLSEVLGSSTEHSVEYLETTVYAIPKIPGASDQINKPRQRAFFKDVYQLLFGKDAGPRLSTYLWATDKKKVRDLINIAKDSN